MHQEFWYRCIKCGYMYTPQQFQALAQLQASHSGEKEADLLACPERVPCRNRGCAGHLSRTESEYKEGAR
jgi:rubredoxin